MSTNALQPLHRPDSPHFSPSTLEGTHEADEKAPAGNSEQATPHARRTSDSEKSALPEELEGGVILAGERGAVPAAGEFPDGGWRAWSVVAGAWCVSFTTWGFVNSFGVFQTHYATNQLADRSSSDISWIGSFQLCMVLSGATVSGAAFDAGYIKHLLCAGTLLYAAGLFGLSFATQYWQIFLAQGVACGVACGIVFLPAVSCISHFFKKRRATALGFLATGSSLGGVIYPIMNNRNFNNPSIGFGWGVRAAGFLTTGLLVIACLLLTTRLPTRKGTILKLGAYKDPAFTLYVLGASFVMLGLYCPMFYIESYSIKHGVDPDFAFYSLSILNAASMFGRIIPNWLADTYGPLTILFPNCVLSGVLIFCWLPMAKSEAGLVVFALLFGFTSGAYVSTMPACVAVMTEDMSEIGVRIAMAFLGISLAALVGTPITGAIISSQSGSYQGAAIFAGVVVLIGSGLVAASRVVLSRRKGTPWV